MFTVTAQAPAVIAQEMKKAVHGSRALGAATTAGIQTSRVNRLNIDASIVEATRGRMDNNTAAPHDICPMPVR